MSSINYVLQNGALMPALGFGTWQARDEELESALETALEIGYRLIDTAHAYENEKVIGKVLNRWIMSGKLKRDELFVVSKLPVGGNRPEGVLKYLSKSLADLQLDYLDLYLIHAPFSFADTEGDSYLSTGLVVIDKNTDHIGIWKALEAQVDAGKIKAIGLSNFNINQMNRIIKNCRIKPANAQNELHLYLQQEELVEFCKKHGMSVTAYSPLGSLGFCSFSSQLGAEADVANILEDPTVKEIAKKHGKTEAQIVLRFGIERSLVVIPKSTSSERIQMNMDIFEFSLDDCDVERLQSLDKGEAGRVFDFTFLSGVKEHPEYPFQ